MKHDPLSSEDPSIHDRKAIVEIIGAHECPLYRVGDELRLNGAALTAYPLGKPTCIILAVDIQKALKRYENADKDPRYRFDCSGCTGFIKLEYRKPGASKPPETVRTPQDIGTVMNLLGQFSFFRALEEEQLRELLYFIRVKKFDAGETILRKGEPGRNLYIMVSGKVAVMGDGDVVIAYLGKGEIFGEMSLLSGEAVGATVQAVEPSKMLYLSGEDFRRVLDSVPSLQMYLACLLAQRLARTNTAMFDELSSEIMGKLSEMAPPGLFQMFNLNQKTGLIRMDLPNGQAEVAFLDGELVRADYNGMSGVDAFFQIMGLRQGRFKFRPGLGPEEMSAEPLGDFMKLLMDGVRRIDEVAEGS